MNRQQNEQLVTALYCRTAHASYDGIELQKQRLMRYAKEHGMYPLEFYIDDGFSGTNFSRPSFLKMCEAIESGKIATVIASDISRIGRNSVDVLHFIQEVLPTKGVVFYTVSDDMVNNLPMSKDFVELITACRKSVAAGGAR